MSGIIAGDKFKMSKADTPTRAGERISTISEMESIPTPYVGMQVYVEDEGVHYVVKSLKSVTVGGVEVSGMAVDAYEPLTVKNAETADVSETTNGFSWTYV